MQQACSPVALARAVVEPLPEATAVDEVVLLHGWGTDSRIWGELVPRLRHRCRIHLLDLPGFGGNAQHNLWPNVDQLLDALAAALPARAHLVGWSLGGNLALALSARFPERVQSLSLVACNPSFVAREGHQCAMGTPLFEQFLASAERDPQPALRRFEQLQCHQDLRGKGLLKSLRTLNAGGPAYSGEALLDALAYLGRVDQRADLQSLSGAVRPLFVLGERDALVPVDLAASLPRVRVMAGTAHVPMLADPEGLAALLLDEFRRHPDEELARRKQQVARSFSKAAQTYDSVASLQRDVAARLLDLLPSEAGSDGFGVGVDLGCGTGTQLTRLRTLQPGRCWLGGDIALGMLQHLRSHDPLAQGRLLALDAEYLPLADQSVELLFSNLALQWCEDLDGLFGEVARVLAPGGYLVFSTLLRGTLSELRRAWSSVDRHEHVNRFYSETHWSAAVRRSGLVSRAWQPELLRTSYAELSDLVHELRALGAHNVNQGRPRGLTGRQHWRALRQAYECNRDQNGTLPATWCLLYGVLHKPASGVVS